MVVFNKVLDKEINSVLLIDDDEDDITIFQLALQTVDDAIELQFTQSGFEAFVLLAEAFPNFPSLIFLDLNMPKLNGLDCLSQLKVHDHWKDIPVVILTTSVDEKDKRKAFELGAVGFISKPNSFSEFCSVLNTILKPSL